MNRTGTKVESGKWKVDANCAQPFPFRLSHFPFPPRRAITLIEILISMFVLLFGLMGVAAIFPVASHYIVEGEKRDRGSGLAQIAFEELKSRKILRPNQWMYANHPTLNADSSWVIQSSYDNVGSDPQPGMFRVSDPIPGNAFVIDPLGAAQVNPSNPFSRWFFPTGNFPIVNPWPTLRLPGATTVRSTWPVLRVSIPRPKSPPNPTYPYLALDPQSADMTFRLRDDLAVAQPEAGDRPSIQTWSQSGGQLLARQYTGDYSWLATVVPTRQRALLGLQPAANIKDEFYEITTVVFYKRDIVPSASVPGSPGSERLISADFLNSGELAIYSQQADDVLAAQEIDLSVDGIKPTNWIAVMGVNQTTGMFMMKWYKILALDDETAVQPTINTYPSNGQPVRFVMVQGPEWPSGSYTNLRVAILPGAIDAYTRVMQIEQE